MVVAIVLSTGVVNFKEVNNVRDHFRYSSVRTRFPLHSSIFSSFVYSFSNFASIWKCFSADNSPSRYEFLVAREFFQEIGGLFHVVVAIEAADGGSLLRPRHKPARAVHPANSF